MLMVTPPMVQLNCPYAAGPHLAGFLQDNNVDCIQADASLSLALRVFSAAGVSVIAAELGRKFGKKRAPASVRSFLSKADQYEYAIDPAIEFLQGKNESFAYRVANRQFLPEGPRFQVIEQFEGATGATGLDALARLFGELGVQDRAKYLCSLFVDDLADVVREGIDDRFGLSRYADSIALSATSFAPIRSNLEERTSIIDGFIEDISDDLLERHNPDIVGFTVPFPGMLYGALRMARRMKRKNKRIKIVMGGGYPSTELRGIFEPGFFDYVDFLVLDDGRYPLLAIIDYLNGRKTSDELCRTFIRENKRVVFKDNADADTMARCDPGTPVYDGLDLDSYFSLCEMPNRAHRLWSDGKWNKMFLAGGCYWHKCSFCDTSLPYINSFTPRRAKALVDCMERVIERTGWRGFHFVDEAAPPALLAAMSEELLNRKMPVSWWTNIRFEKHFSEEACRLLARAGCIAVTGGMEGVTDRILRLMNKGITLESAIKTMGNFSCAGIMVHCYLMYGFPMQDEHEVIDGLEITRQLFETGCAQSVFWHRFALTVHSQMSREPEKYGIRILAGPVSLFAMNELSYEDPTKADFELLGEGLRVATYNYMFGVGLENDVRSWFDCRMPRPRMGRNFVRDIVSGSSGKRGKS